MHLQFRYAVDDADTRLFHHGCRSQIVFFIKTGFQFYENSDFLSVLRRCNQGIDDGRIFSYTVLCHHNLPYRRFMDSFVEEVDEVFERMVGVVQQ